MQYRLSEESERLLQLAEEKAKRIQIFDQGQALEDKEEENRILRVFATLNLNSSGPSLEQTRSIIQGGLTMEREYNRVRTIAFNKLYAGISSINALDLDELVQIHKQLNHETREVKLNSLPDVAMASEDMPAPTMQNDPFRKDSNLHIRQRIYSSPFDPSEAEDKTRKLFTYLQNSDDHWLTQSTIAHLTISAYQPFENFNDELGRLWQSVLLSRKYSMLAYLPWERILGKHLRMYYQALEEFEQEQKAGAFIEFIFRAVNTALRDSPVFVEALRSARGRLDHFLQRNHEKFVRADYRKVFPKISPTTASRDLSMGVELGFLIRHGSKNNSVYSPTEQSGNVKTGTH